MIMKTLTIACLTVLLLFSFGCRDITGSQSIDEVIKASISSSEVFEYRTGMGGDEEGAVIIKQPEQYKVSTIVRDSTTNFEPVYRYIPERGFQGVSQVGIRLQRTIIGETSRTETDLIRLEISVKN